MNFAYVQYFTGTARPKTIISTSAIKNFEPRSEDDYKKGHLYDALLTPDGGEPGCFKAQILLLAGDIYQCSSSQQHTRGDLPYMLLCVTLCRLKVVDRGEDQKGQEDPST